MKEFLILLQKSAYDKRPVTITTKSGKVTGMFSHLDEFSVDPERLGVYIDVSEHETELIFEDEIISINGA